jgi:DNA primase
MMIPEAKIEEVRERVDIIALVQRHGVELKKSGKSYKGRCPFHQEKTPSFYVFPDGKRFKCFGCQAGGDAISFVQRLLGKPFVETVKDLAKELGIDIEGAVDPATKEKAQLKEATDLAARHFQERLWDPVKGLHAREYLHGRGLTDDLIRSFGLGYAPQAWTDLADALQTHGLLAFAERAGLIAPRQKTDGYYDTFRGRVMIPIRSPEGRVIAFGGRLLEGDDGPKYLNSKESRLYNKSEILYAVDQARDEIRKKKSAVLCEGYFDAIGLHQAGVKNAVALCSTALTPGHLGLLHRLDAKELVLLLDGDEAGRKAVERLAPILLAAGWASRVAVLPEGEDPDTFARKVGTEGVQKLLHDAKPLTEHLFHVVLPEGPAASFEAKMAALERLRPIAGPLPVGLMRSAFFASLARHSGLPAQELEVTLRGKPSEQLKPVPKPGALLAAEPPPGFLEAVWGAFVLRDRRLLSKDEWRVILELKHQNLRKLIEGIASGQAPEDAMYDTSESLKGALLKARDQIPKDDEALEPAFTEVCLRLKLLAVEDHLKRITREISQVPGAAELTEDARELLEQQRQLVALKADLKSRLSQK